MLYFLNMMKNKKQTHRGFALIQFNRKQVKELLPYLQDFAETGAF